MTAPNEILCVAPLLTLREARETLAAVRTARNAQERRLRTTSYAGKPGMHSDALDKNSALNHAYGQIAAAIQEHERAVRRSILAAARS